MPTGLERTVTGEQPRTLPVAATGTALSLATCTTPIATLTSTATSLSSGPEGQARILSWALARGGGVIAITSVLPTLMQRALAHSASFVADVLFAWSATSVLTALPACQLPGCVSPGQPVKPAARRHPGRDRAEHTWHLALAAYRFAVPGQALETGRVLASLRWHDLPIQTGAGSRPRRPRGDPSGRDTRCHRDARPASQSVWGERAGGFVHAAFAAPAAPVEQVPGGPCTGNLREGRAVSVPATDAATQSPDP